jgi:hypothetical protein
VRQLEGNKEGRTDIELPEQQGEHEGGEGMGSKMYELFQEVLDKIQHIVDKLNETGEEDKRNSEDQYKMNIKKLKFSQEYLYSGIILTCHILSWLGPLVARDTTFLATWHLQIQPPYIQ